MNFLKRVGYGWLLMSESFFSIFSQHTQLVKAAALLCLVPVLFFIFENTVTTSLFAILHVGDILGLLLFITIAFVLYAFIFTVFAALYYYFAAFLQNRRVLFNAAYQAVMANVSQIQLWMLLTAFVRGIIPGSARGGVLHLLWSWVTFFVLLIIVIDNTTIADALRKSALLAYKRIPELIGFGLWNLVVGLWSLLLGAVGIGAPVHLLFKVAVLYFAALFALILLIAHSLFAVALYLVSAGQTITWFTSQLQNMQNIYEQES